MKLLVTRPEPEASEQAGELRQLGHDPVISPMLEVTLRDPKLRSGAAVDATGLIVTSRNALKALQQHPVSPDVLTKPIFCVGPGTADLARTLGFRNVSEGPGNSEGLVQLIWKGVAPDGNHLLRLTGKTPSKAPERLSCDLTGSGYKVTDILCYDVTPAPDFTTEVRALLTGNTLIAAILMSPLTAKTFMDCLRAVGLTVQSENLRYICLSEAVAEALCGIPQESVFIADKPNRTALLSIVDRVVAELS